MSNTHIIDSLSTLFSMSTTAVLGAQEQFIAFMNPAAQELFRGDRTNHKLSELLPDHITEATATEFVTSAMVGKRHVIVSVTSFGAFRLFSLEPQDENTLRAGAQFAPFLTSLSGLHTLTTYFHDYGMQLSDVHFRHNAAELKRFYYRLLRFADRTALSDYLMGKYDTSWGQDTASPFIMENDKLMDGWRPNTDGGAYADLVPSGGVDEYCKSFRKHQPKG